MKRITILLSLVFVTANAGQTNNAPNLVKSIDDLAEMMYKRGVEDGIFLAIKYHEREGVSMTNLYDQIIIKKVQDKMWNELIKGMKK